jgi:hypothetical protein
MPVPIGISSTTPIPQTPATPIPLTGRRPVRPSLPKIETKEIARFEDGSDTNIEWDIFDNALYLHNVDTGKHVYLKIGSIRSKLSHLGNCIFLVIMVLVMKKMF